MAPDLRVCFLGDSFVAGVGDPDHLGWVGRICARSHQAGRPLTAYNLGVRRQTSSDVRARWLAECTQRLSADWDSRVVVSFGVNDTTIEGGAPRVPREESAQNLAAVLAAAAAADWPALVVGPPPVADRAQNDRTAELDAVLARVATAAAVPYIAVFPQLLASTIWAEEVAAGDGAHPGAAGYQVWADLVWPGWQDWATQPPGREGHLQG